MNGHCSTCEPKCGYEYKPCDCADYRKFKIKAESRYAAKIIPLNRKEKKDAQ